MKRTGTGGDRFDAIMGKAIAAVFGMLAVGAAVAAACGWWWHLGTAMMCGAACLAAATEDRS